MILGYDAHKKYQGVLDYDALKASGKFIIIKAGEGWLDYKTQDYVKLAKDNGLLIGTYWYYRQRIMWGGKDTYCEPKKQAQMYFEATKGNEQDLPPALDIEKTGNPYFRADDIHTCLQEIERLAGRIPMIYTGKFIWEDDVKSPAWSTNYPLWLAQYRDTSKIELPKPFTTWAIHQFSETTEVAGKIIDHDYFNGDMLDLLAFCGIGEIQEPPVKPLYVEVIANFLRFRPLPEYEPIKTLIVEKGQVLEIAGSTIYEPLVPGVHDGIYWLPVFLPTIYGEILIGYISANKKYVKYL